MTSFFVDCSNHDWQRGPMDLGAMLRDGISGGWHKVSDGLNYYADPYAIQFFSRAKAAGWPVQGGYHVLWGNKDIHAQAVWFVSLLDQKAPWWRDMARAGHFVLMSDNEPFGYNVKPTTDQINAFGDAIKSLTGLMSCAYAPSWVYESSVADIHYPVVGSNYGSNPRTAYRAAYPGDGSSRWGTHDELLQYGSQLVVGSQPNCDVNAFGGTLTDFERLMGGTGDMGALDEVVPNTGGRSLGTCVSDAWHGFMTFKSGYDPTAGIPLSDAVIATEKAAVATLAKLNSFADMLQKLIDMIQNAGGNVDSTAIIAHLDQLATEVGQRESDLVAQLRKDNVDLRAALHTALQGAADVVGTPTTT